MARAARACWGPLAAGCGAAPGCGTPVVGCDAGPSICHASSSHTHPAGSDLDGGRWKRRVRPRARRRTARAWAWALAWACT
eukprot:scaffold111107_cov75-Phaeocystis_antarctica.AAC.1